MTFAPSWSKDEDSYLLECLNEGMSFSEAGAAIGARFGTRRSRNSAIGRAHRLGLHSQIPPSQAGQTKYAVRRPWEEEGISYRTWCKRNQTTYRKKRKDGEDGRATFARVREALKLAERAPKVNPDKFQPCCVEVDPLHVAFTDLKPESCRWPYGETLPFTYCGHLAMGGHSYCRAHFALSIGHGTPRERRAHHDLKANAA